MRFGVQPEFHLATWAFTRSNSTNLRRDRSAFGRDALKLWALMAIKKHSKAVEYTGGNPFSTLVSIWR
jgi:hypothetical protein